MSDDHDVVLPGTAGAAESVRDPFSSLFDTAVAAPAGPLLAVAPVVPVHSDESLVADPGIPMALGLERHARVKEPRTGVLDWGSLVLAVVVPPLGVIVAIVAFVVDLRLKGFVSTPPKVALALGIILSLVIGVALSFLGDAQSKQAAHDAVVASSAKFCTQLKASPGLLSSSTYDFPQSADTINDSIAAVQKYDDFWVGLVKVAPAGIKTGTQSVETAAAAILGNARSSRVFDDSNNAGEMQSAVASSGINDWVSQYCN